MQKLSVALVLLTVAVLLIGAGVALNPASGLIAGGLLLGWFALYRVDT